MLPISCANALENMGKVAANAPVRNYTQLIEMSQFTIITELFSEDCLNAYSAWNLGKSIKPEWDKHFSPERGGEQGNYRKGMQDKIANVIDCLDKFPASKRAVITIPNNPSPIHSDDADAKCLREVHLHLEKNKLNATAIFRAQAVSIFPKNIHFIGSMMTAVASQLKCQPELGQLFYMATILTADRQA